jgi:endosialidase-like protein
LSLNIDGTLRANAGNLGIANNVVLPGAPSAATLALTATTASSGPTTGALTMVGGLGIKGGIYSSSDNAADRGLTIDGDTNNSGWIGLRSNAGVENWVFGQAGYSNQDFSIVNVTGASAAALGIRRADNSVVVWSGVTSTSPTTGALTVAGGIGADHMTLGANGLVVQGPAAIGTSPHGTTSGAIKVGYAGGGTQYGMVMRPAADNTVAIYFANAANAQCGSISITATTTTYGTSSDGRLKTDLQPFDAGPIIDRTNVFHFEWKVAPGERAYGVIAQEAIEIFPDAISHDEIQDTWGVDYSKYVPLLLQEIKSLRARVAALEIT